MLENSDSFFFSQDKKEFKLSKHESKKSSSVNKLTNLPSVLEISTGFPVPFLRKVCWLDLMVPLGAPKVPRPATLECAPPSKLYLPLKLLATALEVVPKPKVLPVGAKLAGYCDLYRWGRY